VQNTLPQSKDDQRDQALHDELTLELRELERMKTHLAAQLATRKRAADQAQTLADAKRKVAEMQPEIQKLQEAVGECA